MSDAEEPIPASDLPTRFAMGLAMVVVAVFAIASPTFAGVWGHWIFRFLVLAGAAVMLLEWADMHGVSRRWGHVGGLFLAATLLIVTEMLFPAAMMDAVVSGASFHPAWRGFAAAAAFAVLLGLLARRLTMAGGFLYIAIPSVALLAINWVWFGLTFWMMIVTWATDIFAYFAGRAIGGPKLAPRISPNKTWAGLGGGIAGAAATGALAAWYFDLGAPFLYIGGAMGAIAQAGDLYESWLKRRAGVKDSGTILPGHGGALDRLDGLLPVIVVTFLILAAGLWSG